MKPILSLTSRFAFPLALASILATPLIHAAPYYWDTDADTAGAGGATPLGIWATGGTTWSTSADGTATTPAYTTQATDDLFFSAGTNATGTFAIDLTSAQNAGSLTFQEGVVSISGTGGVVNLGGAGGKITVNNGATATIGATTDTIVGGSVGLTKLGVGTLTLNNAQANTFTGGITVDGGILGLNFPNLATPTNLVDSTNTLALGGGQLTINAKGAGEVTTQTLGNVTVNSGGGRILLNPNGGTSTTLNLGSITATASGGSLLVGTAIGSGTGAAIITTTTDKDATGIYGGRVIFGNGTTGTGFDWATTNDSSPGPYTLAAYTGYTALDTFSIGDITDSNNSTVSSTATLPTASNRTTNTLKFENPATAQTFSLGSNTLTLSSGGLLFSGASVAQGPRISAGNITAGNGSGSYNLVVHQYNVTAQNIATGISGTNLALVTTISANITDNGANPVTLVKAGTGSLVISGTNTFTGGIVVNQGNIAFNSATAINNNAITFNASSVVHTFSGSSTSGGITLNNNCLVTILNNNNSFTVSGKVTGTGGVAVAQGGLGSVTLNLTSTENDFTGPIRFQHSQQNQSAHITVGSLADTDTYGTGNITFGAPGNATTSSHNFNYGATAAAALTLNNRRFELAGSALVAQSINNNSSRALTINSDLLTSGTGTKTLTFGGTGSGASIFAGKITNGSLTTLNITKAGAGPGTWTLSGDNSYTGTTSLSGGTTSVLIADHANALGNGGNITFTGNGVLRYTANSASTDWSTRFKNSTFGIGIATAGLTVTYAGIIDNTNVNGIIKYGGGNLILSGANSFTGVTMIDQGAVVIGTDAPVSADGALGNSATEVNLGTAGSGSFAQLHTNGAFTVGRAIRLRTANATDAGTRVLTIGGITAHNSVFSGDIILGSLNQSSKGIQLTAAAGGKVTVAGVIQDPTGQDAAEASGAANINSVTKVGLGTVELTNTNTYVGRTAINAGTLALGANEVLPSTSVIIGNGTLDAVTFDETMGTLDVTNAASKVNLGAGANLVFADSSAVDWAGGTLNITGTFVSGSSLRFGTTDAGLTDPQLALITAPGFTGFDLDGNGFLTATPDTGNPYITWSGGLPFGDDANADQVENGLAWLLGAAVPTTNASSLLPTATQSSGNLVLTFSMLNAANRGGATMQLQHSSDLGVVDPWASVLVPESTSSVSGINFTITADGNMNDVTATIPSSEGANGKLFGRLKGESAP